jgi:hypothetical protein
MTTLKRLIPSCPASEVTLQTLEHTTTRVFDMADILETFNPEVRDMITVEDLNSLLASNTQEDDHPIAKCEIKLVVSISYKE